jgi:hypothetical protein
MVDGFRLALQACDTVACEGTLVVETTPRFWLFRNAVAQEITVHRKGLYRDG